MKEEFDTDMAIGDLESQDKGSAARANRGKPRWSLMPLRQIAHMQLRFRNYRDEPIYEADLTNALGEFQEKGGLTPAFHTLFVGFAYFMHNAGVSFDEACQAVIRVWEMGEKKYKTFNWMKGMDWSEPINSAQRHVMKLFNGHTIDEDSGEHHAAHYICNAMMLVHYVEHYVEGNDLPVEWFD